MYSTWSRHLSPAINKTGHTRISSPSLDSKDWYPFSIISLIYSGNGGFGRFMDHQGGIRDRGRDCLMHQILHTNSIQHLFPPFLQAKTLTNGSYMGSCASWHLLLFYQCHNAKKFKKKHNISVLGIVISC